MIKEVRREQYEGREVNGTITFVGFDLLGVVAE